MIWHSGSRSLLAAAVLIGATCAALGASPARANLVVNGSFESPNVTGPVIRTSLPGWTLNPNIEIQPNPPIIYSAQQGKQWVELDSNANTSISQAIPVTLGLPYKLKFYYSPKPNNPASSNGMNVKLNGATIFSLATSGIGLANTSWSLHSYTHTAATSSTTITFTGTGTSDTGGAFLDNVSYTQAPGPLPLMAVGVAFGCSRKLRRRIKSAGLS
ncbi:MAG: DUF642 domain-containing protein [Cyanobium sp.]